MTMPRSSLLLPAIALTAALTLTLTPASYVFADEFAIFGGSGGGGSSRGLGGAGSSLSNIGGKGGNASNLNSGSGGGGGEAGYIDGADSGGGDAGSDGVGFIGGAGGGTDGGYGGPDENPGGDATGSGGGGGAGNGSFSTAKGGNGGPQGGGGGGGGFAGTNPIGGSASVFTRTMSMTTYSSVAIEGGNGGEGGSIPPTAGSSQAGGGGDGGGAEAIAGTLLEVNGDLLLRGGNGGNGGNGDITGAPLPSGKAGDGGSGGIAILDATGKEVRVQGQLAVTSGLNGTDGVTGAVSASTPGYGGAGGDAVFTAGTLSAPVINLTQNDGALSFTVTTLDVSAADTVLNLSGTTAAGVTIGAAHLSNDKVFTMNNTQGDATISVLNITGTGGTLRSTDTFAIATANLGDGALFVLDNSAGYPSITTFNVNGAGRLFTLDGRRQSITTLNAAGAHLTIVLPDSLQANDTAVSVGTANLLGTTLGVAYQSARPNLDVGQSFILLDAATLTTDIVTMTVQSADGDIYTLTVAGNQILAVRDYFAPTTPAYERLKAYAEGRAVTLGFVNQGQELLINQGFGSALAATSGSGFRLNAFGGMGGGKSRYHSGSHVDVEGFSMLAGLAVANDTGPGRLTLGAFFEGGWGSYNSHNSFSNYASVNGNGDTSYYGGGLLGTLRPDLRRIVRPVL